MSFDHYILWTELKIGNFDTRYTEVVKGFFATIEATQVIIKLIFVKRGIAQTTNSPSVFVRGAL